MSSLSSLMQWPGWAWQRSDLRGKWELVRELGNKRQTCILDDLLRCAVNAIYVIRGSDNTFLLFILPSPELHFFFFPPEIIHMYISVLFLTLRIKQPVYTPVFLKRYIVYLKKCTWPPGVAFVGLISENHYKIHYSSLLDVNCCNFFLTLESNGCFSEMRQP